MKGYYDNALQSEDNKKVVIANTSEKVSDNNYDTNESNIETVVNKNDENILNKDSVETQEIEYNFERYTEHKPEETQVCGSSLSRGAIITLISVMACIVVTIVVIIVVKTINGSSKASATSFDTVNSSIENNNQSNESDGSGTYDDENTEDVDSASVDTNEDANTDANNTDVVEENNTEEEQPTPEPTVSTTLINDLKELANKDSKASVLWQNVDNYPERLLEDVVRNPEMLDYTINYPNMVNKTYTDVIDITSDVQNQTYGMPYFIQWDSRWGYYPYSSGVIGISGCGPTCLSMVYVHLTGDTTWNPLKMAKYSTEKGYVTVGVGTSWSLMTTGAQNIGLQSEKIANNESIMISHLLQGHPLIASMGPGIFTDRGHFIVFRKYENGMFYVNDPFCVAHTNKAWSYSEFASQIKSVWAYWR